MRVRTLRPGDVHAVIERVITSLAADARHSPLISTDLDTATLADSLRASGDATLVALEGGRVVGHLYAAVLAGPTGLEAWTGPDGWSGEARVMEALRARAFASWRESGVTSHHAWVCDEVSRTSAWIAAGYRPEDVRGLRALHGITATASTYAIRRGTPDDFASALAFDEMIDVAHGLAPEPAHQRGQSLGELLDDPDVTHHVLVDGDDVLAQCITFALEPTRATPPATLQISAVAVAPPSRRRGLARILVGHVLAEARDAGFTHAQVTWRRDNAPADALWSSMGFARTYARLRGRLS